MLKSFTAIFAVIIFNYYAISVPVYADNGKNLTLLEQLNPDRLAQLVRYFEQRNLDLKSLIEDPRFEIYDGIGDRFRNSAERRTLSLEEYKRILNFEDKRLRITGFMDTYAIELAAAE